MKSIVRHLTLLTLIFSIFKFGECNPKCYICDSITDPNCVHPDKHRLDTHECMPNGLGETKNVIEKVGLDKLSGLFDIEVHRNDFSEPLSCMKMVSKVRDQEVIVRSCQYSPNGDLDFCKKLKEEGKSVVTHCSLCSENGCNSAPIKVISLSMMALIIPALAIL